MRKRLRIGRPASYAHPVKPPARQRAFIALLVGLLVPLALTTSPAASAEEEPAPVDDPTSVAPAGPLLDSPERGRTAIRELGDQLDVAAARNDLGAAELRTLLRTDESVWIDPEGMLYYVDPAPRPTPDAGETPAAAAPLSETFELHSNPGASRTILLDFDGAEVTGTGWNALPLNVTPGSHPAWDPAGDGPSFSDGERAKVQQVWAMVAEDYAPFDVDVTTQDPGTAGLVRSSSSDTVYGTRVLVTPSDDPFAKICSLGCGGVAYISVFDDVGTYHQPAWVFPQGWATTPRTSPRRPPTRRATTSASPTTAPMRRATTPGTGRGRRSWESATTGRWCSGAGAPTSVPTTSRTT